MVDRGYRIGNLDVTLILQSPKVLLITKAISYVTDPNFTIITGQRY